MAGSEQGTETCDAPLALADRTIHCQELVGHDTDPTPEDGTPHSSDEYLDVLTGEPWRWW